MEDEKRSYPGEICFKKCDIDLCDVLIFNKIVGEGRFNGKSIGLQQFYMIIIWRKGGIEFKDDKIYKYKRYR